MSEDTISTGQGDDGATGGSGNDTLMGDAAPQQTVPAQAAPDPVKPTEPVKEPEKPTEQPKVEPFVSDAVKRLAELDSAIDKEDFDPYSPAGKAIIKEHAHMVARVESQPGNEAAVWTSLSDEYDLSVKQLKSMWQETCKGMPDKFKGNQAAAEYAFLQKIESFKAAKNKAPAPKPKETPVIAPGQVLPRGAGSVPPQPPSTDERTLEEKVLAGDKSTLDKFKNVWTELMG